MAGHDSTQPLAFADGEEARLLNILAACMEVVTAARHGLSNPSHSLFMPEYRKLEDDLEMARAECAKARAALREYREGSRGQAARDSK